MKTHTIEAVRRAVKDTFKFSPSSRLTGAEFRKACSLAKAKLGVSEKDDVEGIAAAVRAEEQANLSAKANSLASVTQISRINKERAVFRGGNVKMVHSVVRDRSADKVEAESALRAFLKKEEPKNASEIAIANFEAKRRSACLALRKICPGYDLEQSKIEAARAAEYVAALIKSGVGE